MCTGTFQSVCPECGCFASHTIFTGDHHRWACRYCPASGWSDPWEQIPWKQHQEVWDKAAFQEFMVIFGPPRT